MKKLIFIIPILLLTINMTAQKFDKAKLDKYFKAVEENDKGMGSLSIFKDGKEIYQKSIGYCDISNKAQADALTKYRIGSISKTFTAAIILQMVEEKKLTLDTKLSKYYKEIPNADKITIEHLLRHRSGIFNFTSVNDYLEWCQKPHSHEDVLKKIIKNGTIFEPGEKAEYSNSGYVLLSYIAEKIDRKSFYNVLKNRITIPFKLENTYYGGKINTKGNEAQSYTKLDNWTFDTETDMSVPAGAGAVVSNSTDVNSFFTQLFAGKIINKESLQQMKTLKDEFGMGLFSFPFNDKKAFGHTGGIDGFQSMSGHFPTENITITYLSNGVDLSLSVNDILIAALSAVFGEAYEIPTFKPTFEVSDNDLDSYLGVYSSPSLPIKITITKKGKILFGQATGQSSFPLEASEKHKFKFEPANVKLEFKPEESIMVFMQAGMTFEMTKEEKKE